MEDKLWLRGVWVVTMTAAFYPLVAFLGICSGMQLPLSLLPYFLVICFGLLGGALRVLCFRWYRRKPLLLKSLTLAFALLILIGGTIFAPYSQVLSRVVYGLMAAGSFFAGNVFLLKPFSRLTHGYVFAGLCTWDVLMEVFLSLSHVSVPLLPEVLILLCNGVLFTLVQNAHALTRLIRDRDGECALPEEIRHSNRHLMLLFCGIGVVLVCCYRFLAKLLRFLGKELVRFGLFLLRLLFSSDDSGDVVEQSTTSTAAQQTEQAAANPWIGKAIEIGVLLVVLALLVWKRREIIQFLFQCLRSFQRWIREKLQRLQQQEPETDCAYCDYVEDLMIQTTPQTALESPRNWRRQYRRYQRMQPTGERFRLGYMLLLAKLPSTLQKPTDSPQETLEQLQGNPLYESWEQVTEVYERVRYGLQEPVQEEFLPLDRLLRNDARARKDIRKK